MNVMQTKSEKSNKPYMKRAYECNEQNQQTAQQTIQQARRTDDLLVEDITECGEEWT